MKKFIAEFKAFIKKGNVVDLAVAVVIGNAFNKIVNSLVNDIIMPLISLMIGGADVSDWKWVIREAQYDSAGTVVVTETALKYGIFIQAFIDFMLIALTIFFVVKLFNASRKRFEVISEKFIAETKELTKKQLKALKKISKKVRKGKIDTETAEQLAQAEGVTLTENNTEISQESVTPVENSTTTANDVTDTVVEAQDSQPNTPSTEQDLTTSQTKTSQPNDELLEILKEIRDSLKKS